MRSTTRIGPAVLIGLCILVQPLCALAQPTKRAVLIGIDNYQSDSIPPLHGGANDVRLMQQVLVGRFGFLPENVLVLENERATHGGILAAVRSHLIETSQQGDVAVLHFSGHGSQMKDANGDETDGLDETLVAYDSRMPGIFDISDDEINVLLRELTGKTANVTFIFDSCHSGTVTRILTTGDSRPGATPEARVKLNRLPGAPSDVSSVGRLTGEAARLPDLDMRSIARATELPSANVRPIRVGRPRGSTARFITMDQREPPDAGTSPGGRSVVEAGVGLKAEDARYVLLAGCLSRQVSNEADFDGRRHGALTWNLAKALAGASDRLTYRQVMDTTRAGVSARFPAQTPQIEGAGADSVVFGAEQIPTRPYILADPSGDGTVRLEAGQALGLQPRARLAVYPPGTTDFSSAPVAKVRVESAADFESTAAVTEGGPIAPRSRAVVTEASFGGRKVAIFLEGDSPEMKRVREELAAIGSVAIGSDPSGASLIVRSANDMMWIESGDLEVVAPPVPATDPGAVARVAEQVRGLLRWMNVLELTNGASTLKVGLVLRRDSDPEGAAPPQEVVHGSKIVYSMVNDSGRSLYLYLLDLASDGSIGVLWPPKNQVQDATVGGGRVVGRLSMSVPEGRTYVTDTLKVLATSQPIDVTVFEQGEIREGREPKPMTRVLAALIRNAQPDEPVAVAADTWVTTQQQVRVRADAPRLASYALHFDAPTTAQELLGRLSASRAVCQPGSPSPDSSCAAVRPVAADNTVFELTLDAAAQRELQPGGGQPASAVRVGRAFEEAYRLQEQTGARRVEPELELRVPGDVDDRGIDKRDISGDDTHDPAAAADDSWSLKQIGAEAALQKVRERLGRAEGDEAGGILIAHVDTGYLHHPETWEEVGGKRPVDAAKGHNYYEDSDDALDPLLDDRLLDNPGHGTASGSVIVSPRGCQLTGSARCVNGVARGAQLIPLRVHRTVSQFNTRNLSRAIQDVADGKVAGGPHLISIAMGGPPTYRMWKAVTAAEARGILIVAAAGNYVRTVVWPARFRATIAAAADDIRCRPWEHSSRGSAVDITAPGESVWRATLNESRENIIGMGKGTTFATGNTSGAAALWLSYHRDDPGMQDLRSHGLVTRAFREGLKASAWKPSGDGEMPEGAMCDPQAWDEDFGPGILSVPRLLEVQLPAVSPTPPTPRTLTNLPLFASLYPEGTDPARVQADYLRLFPDTRDDAARLESLETEILFHYAVNQDVQRALDGMLAGQRGVEPVEDARRVLLQQELSARLRSALQAQR